MRGRDRDREIDRVERNDPKKVLCKIFDNESNVYVNVYVCVFVLHAVYNQFNQ